MERGSAGAATLILIAGLVTQAAFALTPEGRLDAEAKKALKEMKIADYQVSDADNRREGLARSIRQYILLLRLQAADKPEQGPVAAPGDLESLNRLLGDKLKNPTLPKVAIADMPQELVRALKNARLITDSTKEATPAQMVAWLLSRRVLLELQAELEKLRGADQVKAFWRKLDGSSEKLMIAYNAALAKLRPTPTPRITRPDLDLDIPRESTLPNPIKIEPDRRGIGPFPDPSHDGFGGFIPDPSSTHGRGGPIRRRAE